MFQNSLCTFRCVLLTVSGLAALGWLRAAQAEDTWAQADKSSYNLFNTTPDDQLRPLSIDADDGVTDPTTVDAGHLQLQGSLVDYFRNTTSFPGRFGTINVSADHFDWSPRLSLGLFNNVDLFIHPSFESTSYQYSGAYNATHNSSGYEGINVGTKINLWGNDGGTTALAVAPYVSIPNHGETVLGGADVAFSVRLPDGFYLKFMTDPYAFGNAVYFGMENSMSLHKTFADKLDVYAYLNTVWESDITPWYGYSGFGLAYQFTRNFELFAGIGFGLTSNSYDYNPRLGLNWRF